MRSQTYLLISIVSAALPSVAVTATASAAPASTCDVDLRVSLRSAAREISSLRADKPGQARVFARDGAEFTAGTARWLAAQLHHAERACARDDGAAAASGLADIDAVLNSRRHP
jgi:hypothetical protein